MAAASVGPYRLLRYEQVGSTNDVAMALLRDGDPGGVVVAARQQLGGRGRHGRAWSSPVGNLYASLALVDPSPPPLAPQLGFVVGVALADVLRARLRGDDRLVLKWPNDALHDGAKIAGMLIEGTTTRQGHLCCVVGIGINCVSHPLDMPATDLAAAGDPAPDPLTLLAELAAAIDMRIAQWRRGEAFPEIRRAWLERAAGLGREIEVKAPGRALRGIFRDIDEHGRLRLDARDRELCVEAGDVFLLHPARAEMR